VHTDYLQQRSVLRWLGLLGLVGAVSACSGVASPEGALAQTDSALTAEDGLAQAYGIFKGLFTTNGEDKHHHMGFGYHPGLSTQKLLGPNGVPLSGQITLNFVTDGQGAAGTVTAIATGPANRAFDLYFVKNAVGQGTVKPEAIDQIRKVGTFSAVPGEPTQYTLSANIGAAAFPNFGVNFDLDMIVVTLAGQNPQSNVLATGARTLFEKRFFRERAGRTLDPVVGALSTTVETSDPLVQRGAQLFFNETFAGNGRTCGTCHRIENNLTIDAAFIATLPPSDPLFVVPTGLENPTLLKNALILENLDGAEDPTHKFVERSVPHTLSMSTSIGEVVTQQRGFDDAFGSISDGPPSDQRTGWSGDGAPGRGTLNEFAFGAVAQHFTKSLNRVVGTSFRVPTQAELDALEAFQLFSGRQKNPNTAALTFGDAAATAGRDAALGSAQCAVCHRDLLGDSARNFDINTGVADLQPPSAIQPKDGGFGVSNVDPVTLQPLAGSIATGFGDGQFNVPPLYEAADTAPFFHNGVVTSIEAAVNFYSSPQFLNSPGARIFAQPDQNLFPSQENDIVAFLRTINALTNIVQIRKRVQYLANNATPGGTQIMTIAIKESQDAITDLTSPTLTGVATANALQALRTVKLSLQNSLPFANSAASVPMSQVVTWLGIAESDLITANPLNDF
jgi:cytochrome c peroxidase